MRKIAFLIALMCIVPVKSLAWHDSSAAIKAVTALYRNLETVQKQFAELAPQQACHPDVFIPMDLDGNGVWEIWVRTYDSKAGILYAQTDSGLEIYMRRTDSYGAQHYCIREVGDQFIKMTGAARYRNN